MRLKKIMRVITRLVLILLAIWAFLWAYWGLVTLRNTTCGWMSRIKGSDCVRIISRDVDVGAENVYFSEDDSRVFFLDRSAVKMVPVQRKSVFDIAKSYPVFTLGDLGGARGTPRGFEGFALNLDEMKAVYCVVFDGGASDYDDTLILQDLENENVPEAFHDGTNCYGADTDFAPSTSIISLSSPYENSGEVRFLDSVGDVLRPVQGTHYGRYSDGSTMLPIKEGERVISLYSFPDLVKQNEFEFPSDLIGAQVSPDGEYIYASGLKEAKVYMLEVSTGNIVHTFSEPSYKDAWLISISPKNDLLAISFSGDDGKKVNPERLTSIEVWDLKTMGLIKRIPMNGIRMFPQSIDISSDGKLLAVGTWYYVIVYDLAK